MLVEVLNNVSRDCGRKSFWNLDETQRKTIVRGHPPDHLVKQFQQYFTGDTMAVVLLNGGFSQGAIDSIKAIPNLVEIATSKFRMGLQDGIDESIKAQSKTLEEDINNLSINELCEDHGTIIEDGPDESYEYELDREEETRDILKQVLMKVDNRIKIRRNDIIELLKKHARNFGKIVVQELYHRAKDILDKIVSVNPGDDEEFEDEFKKIIGIIIIETPECKEELVDVLLTHDVMMLCVHEYQQSVRDWMTIEEKRVTEPELEPKNFKGIPSITNMVGIEGLDTEWSVPELIDTLRKQGDKDGE